MRLRLMLLALALAGPALAGEWQHKSAPYSAVRWKGDTPIARVEGTWGEVVSIHGKAAKEILAFCRKRYAGKWKKRFVEDLGEVFDAMKLPPAGKVTVVLKTLPGGELETLEAPMTYALRKQARDAGSDQPYVCVTREHGGADPRFRHLAKRIKPDRYEKDLLAAAKAAEDLDELEGLLEAAYSYLARNKVDHRAALDTIRAGLGKQIPVATFALQVKKLLALFGDGHSDVSMGLGAMGGRTYSPFLFGEHDGGIFLFAGDREALVHEADPFVKAMDGVAIGKWLAAARGVVARGSPQFVRRQARRSLRYVAYLRQELGLRIRTSLEVEFADGHKQGFKLTGDRPKYGAWPRTRSGILPNNLGYMRLPFMSGSKGALKWVEDRMHEFSETKGLILDLRDNGGGTRDVLKVLAAYLLSDKAPPRIASIAAYRLPSWDPIDRPDGYLQNRFLYPLSWRGWNPAQQAAAEAHLKAFRPEWTPPKGRFSKWHVMVLDRSGAQRPFLYRERVVILMNAGCYSATDIFLGALKGLEGVTLMGTPSGGGSGRTRGYRLANSRLEVRLSSMASFQPSGRLYDGNGVAPDIVVKPARGDWIGRGDRILDAAKKKLR